MPRDDGLGPEDVDLSGMPRRTGLTLYASTKLEETAKDPRAQTTVFVTFNPPPGMSAKHALDFHTQVHQALLDRAWRRAQERKLAHMQGSNIPIEQFDFDLVTGEILE
jgi:hypothetical protein